MLQEFQTGDWVLFQHTPKVQLTAFIMDINLMTITIYVTQPEEYRREWKVPLSFLRPISSRITDTDEQHLIDLSLHLRQESWFYELTN